MTVTLKKQQRSAQLCCHCLRNIAYYRAWWDAGKPHADSDFIVNGNGNCIDIAVLEWCKLFTSPKKEKHNFENVVNDPDNLLAAMLAHIGASNGDWDDYKETMKKYRDKYIAHWDDDPDGAMSPVLDLAIASAAYLLDYLTTHGEDGWWPFPQNAMQFYNERRTYAFTCF
jgi:hypothetical protein